MENDWKKILKWESNKDIYRTYYMLICLREIMVGKQQYNQVVSYRSYDPNNVSHTLNRLRHAGSAAPKKKGFIA
jgi:hypothetical protein